MRANGDLGQVGEEMATTTVVMSDAHHDKEQV